MKILIIAAHPDNEVVGCGGTIARLIREGHDVRILIMGEGLTSRVSDAGEVDPSELEVLQLSTYRSANVLGVTDVIMRNLPDNRFDTLPLLETIKTVEDVLIGFCHQIIYTHHGSDLNADHRLVNQAVLTATRPTQGQSVKEIYAFEVPSAIEWSFQCYEPVFWPNYFIDISDTLDLKLKAFSVTDRKFDSFLIGVRPKRLSPSFVDAEV